MNKAKKYTTEEIRKKLRIDGYTIEFPKTWEIHGQARLICYVPSSVQVGLAKPAMLANSRAV
jgi:hypothetical protein